MAEKPTADENFDFVRRYQAGDMSAFQDLCQANQNLVRWAANRYWQKVQHSTTLDYEDLLQEGYIGICKAALSYDLAKASERFFHPGQVNMFLKRSAGHSKQNRI